MSLPTIAPSTGAVPAAVHPTDSPRRAMLAITVVSGFVVRMLVMLGTKAYLFLPTGSPFNDPCKEGWFFGFEIGRVARSIATGHGFGSPFHGDTGPTAWLAPVYPYLLAGVFRVFGTYTQASGIAILTFNSLCAALTAVPIYFIAERTLGPKLAKLCAWSWAVVPYFYWTAVRWAWETCLSTLMLALVLLLTLWLEESDWRGWFACGLLWGAIGLTNPSLLSLAPFALAWAWWRSKRIQAGQSRAGTRNATARAMMAILVAALTVAPWLIRNRETFGQWIFIRDNFGAELRFGNSEQARGVWMGWTDPPLNDVELARYRRSGELRYIADKKREAITFIRQRPAFFLDLSLRRMLLFWFGVPRDYSDDITGRDVLLQWPDVALATLAFVGLAELARQRRGAAWFFAPALLVYPALYYITFPDSRYRHPVEPLMLMLAAFAISESLRAGGRASQKPALPCGIVKSR